MPLMGSSDNRWKSSILVDASEIDYESVRSKTGIGYVLLTGKHTSKDTVESRLVQEDDKYKRNHEVKIIEIPMLIQQKLVDAVNNQPPELLHNARLETKSIPPET